MLNYECCTLCPRRCGVNRAAGELGFCRQPATARAARAAAHYWEEPVISGAFGSGAVFFSGCTLGCVFCQNAQISHGGYGAPVSSQKLREIFERLIDDGVQNINLVTPTQFLPTIIPALTPKLPVPVVYNCGGYESVETLRQLDGLVDIYLPDLKYSDPALAARLSHAADYVSVAQDAIREMVRQTGPYVIRDEIMERGVLLRHLVLPGYVDNSLGVIDWVADTFRPEELLLSVMCQYVPMGRELPPLNRRVTPEEYAAVCSWMQLRGLTHGYLQDFTAAETDYIPPFDLEGIE